MKKLLFLSLAVILCMSCKQNDSSTGNSDKAETKTTANPNKHQAKYAVDDFPASTEYSDAKITSMAYNNGKFKFGVTGDKYQLGLQTPDASAKMCANSAKGQHIHLIVDNKPYSAQYVDEFDYDIEDGEHYILAFLSRSYHESIKSEGAHVAKKVTIKNKSIIKEENITEPMVFYSRPKGTYVGADTEKVMLDFFLVNCDLGDEYFIKANINGENKIIKDWKPHYLTGMEMGENKIGLSLMNKSGKLHKTPLNPVNRKFTLKEELKPEK